MTTYRQQARQIFASANVDEWSAAVEKIVNDALEEAAKVASDFPYGGSLFIAEAIRQLKQNT
jgi:hypothetical protein